MDEQKWPDAMAGEVAQDKFVRIGDYYVNPDAITAVHVDYCEAGDILFIWVNGCNKPLEMYLN